MPNWCSGKITIRGYKDNVEEFLKILDADYNYATMEFSHKPHFFRVFSVDITEMRKADGVIWIASALIDVAWSMYCCLFDGPFSYYDMRNDISPITYATHIEAESKRLSLEIEIFSMEPGMGFQEYYKICSGVLVRQEEYPLYTYDIEEYDSVEDFWNENGKLITREDFNEAKEAGDACVYQGLMSWDTTIPDKSNYLCQYEMVKKVGNKNGRN